MNILGEEKKFCDIVQGEVFVAMGFNLTRETTKKGNSKKLVRAIPYFNGHVFTESKHTEVNFKFKPKDTFKVVGYIHESEAYKKHRERIKR